MQSRGENEPESVLRQINAVNLRLLPAARYAGITVLNSSGTITTLAATDGSARRLDDVQRATGEGPCLSAAWDQHTIHIQDLSSEQRWPRFRQEALDRTPVRSVLSFQLFAERDDVAALNFHAERPGAFDDESVELGLVAATHTMVAWNIISRDRQFRTALASRDVIGQAKGMLMERFDIDAAAAFDLLKRLSQESNTKLVDIAEKVVASHNRPGGSRE